MCIIHPLSFVNRYKAKTRKIDININPYFFI